MMKIIPVLPGILQHDITEEEGTAVLSWTLVEAELTQIHIMEMGGKVPKVYIVTELHTYNFKI